MPPRPEQLLDWAAAARAPNASHAGTLCRSASTTRKQSQTIRDGYRFGDGAGSWLNRLTLGLADQRSAHAGAAMVVLKRNVGWEAG